MKRFLIRGTRRVRVHTISNGKSLTIEGVLVDETRRDLILLCAKVLEEEGDSVTVSGQIEIPRENVVFKQVGV